ncbi:MAG TPA: aryl-sulfate sulfotransferase [Croceibacterium sp.]|nr:aryl-sulfate sulfotransferase [Croceibacterium sp.]
MRVRMTRRSFVGAAIAMSALPAALRSAPTVFPTGTTIFDPAKAWNGFTVLSTLDTPAVLVIDMNGRTVKRWEGLNVSAGGPARVLPGGMLVAPTGAFARHQESTALVAQDFAGRELWRFDRAEEIEPDGQRQWSARQHHDWQPADFPAGYYAPSFAPAARAERTLLLTHTSHRDPAVAGVLLEDDRLVEVDRAGAVTWTWRAADHIGELGFDPAARAAIARLGTRDGYDWLHANSARYLGPNRWHDAGDARFHPDNVIVSSRQASVVFIVARDGSVAWRLGPDFSASPALAAIGQVIGQHDAHLIPPGLPGAGNLLLFDNGGASGLGDPSPISPLGNAIYQRATSRVLEIDPVDLSLVWSYAGPNFFSTNISSAQRLPNGNTLITEGAPGRAFEVTAAKELVWEFMNPPGEGGRRSNALYRAYRVPYGWIPQLPTPREVAITPPPAGSFHVPGTPEG